MSAQSGKQNIVINTDPHIICLEKARLLLAGEFIVYLKASTATQIARISRNPLPLLPTDNIQNFFEQLHQHRDHLYEEMATLIIDTDNNAQENHVQQIVNAVVVEEAGTSYARFLVDEEAKDEMLFVETGKTIIFDENQLMFPLLLHA